MCYGMGCPHERTFTGECRGDWDKPGAACREDLEEDDVPEWDEWTWIDGYPDNDEERDQ